MCQFMDNNAEASNGGGIYLQGVNSVTIVGSNFERNSAKVYLCACHPAGLFDAVGLAFVCVCTRSSGGH